MIPWALQHCSIVGWLQGRARCSRSTFGPCWLLGSRLRSWVCASRATGKPFCKDLGVLGRHWGGWQNCYGNLCCLCSLWTCLHFEFDLHYRKLCGLGLRLWTSIWHRSHPLDFHCLAMAHIWLCHKLWPWVSLLLCHSQYCTEKRLSESASL